MQRHLPLFAALLLIQTIIASSAAAQGPVQVAPARPNIVWFMSEDNSVHHMQLYNPAGAPMPHMEALADSGLVFNHCFSNGAVCSVARTTLITSCYAPRIGAQHHRRAERVPLPEGLAAFPAYLRDAGYYTANNSKTDYNADLGDRAPWDQSSKNASWRNRADGQPFFYVQTLTTTHESSLHFENMDQPTDADPDQMTVAPIYPDTPLLRYTYARYHDRHAQIDRQFGQVVEQLQQDGLMDDTFIFFFGDHGGVLPGSKGYAYERGLHVPLIVYVPKNFRHLLDEDLQSPGMRVDGFIEFVDFGPTVLNLAGIESPEGIDGKPFLGEGVTLEELNERDEAFGYADRFDEKYDMVRTLRVGKYKYMRSFQPFNVDALYNQYRYRQLAYRQWRDLYRAGELNPTQSAFFEPRPAEMLFDVEKDPYETHNLATDPRYYAVLTDLRERLTARVKGMPDLSFLPEPVMLNEGVMNNPVAFGQNFKDEVGAMVDIADLQLLPFARAKGSLEAALKSREQGYIYWALISASSFGEEAAGLKGVAQQAVSRYDDALLTTRLAEFYALAGIEADVPGLLNEALSQCKTEMEALLVLNTVALLHDTVEGFEMDVQVPERFRKNGWVQDRLNYLRP